MPFFPFEQYREIIPDFSLFTDCLLQPFPVHLRINRLKTEPDGVVPMLREQGIDIERVHENHDLFYHARDLHSPGNLLEYFLGHIHPQALTSCLASVALSPRAGSYVLDMCASPGGKASHMAQLMSNTGLIIANELYPTRHIPLAHTISRLGVLNCVLTGYQAQEFPLSQRFDYILSDVPCSGEGRVRLVDGVHSYYSQKSVVRPRLLEMQKKIILRGFDLLKENGVMLYSTCTFNPDENEAVVHFLLENRDADLFPIDVGFHYESGITQWKGDSYDKRIERTARFYPHRINSVGFFMAGIRRRA
ncbi:MAG: RsmB/NOP family class I SAM-dependent RNA methyltransferase [Deltaproteobacteria bacterium]|nr:RsmB/NOP family class I SAM-dependent RNA methyltransferase [Deltaproteobacteria bacterium]